MKYLLCIQEKLETISFFWTPPPLPFSNVDCVELTWRRCKKLATSVLVACCWYKYLLTVFYARMYYIDTPLAMTQIVVLENFSLFSNANLNALVIKYHNIPTSTIQISQMCNYESPIFLRSVLLLRCYTIKLFLMICGEKKIPRILQDII